MKRTMLVACLGFILAGCQDTVTPATVSDTTTNKLDKFAGLEDCRLFTGFLSQRSVVIVRCPNSSVSTTISKGKSGNDTNVVIDDNTNQETTLSPVENSVQTADIERRIQFHKDSLRDEQQKLRDLNKH